MKSNLIAAALVGMIASAGASTNAIQAQPFPAVRPPKTILPSRTVGSSKNGGRKGNRPAQRAAAKARNVRRFRAQSRGSAS